MDATKTSSFLGSFENKMMQTEIIAENTRSVDNLTPIRFSISLRPLCDGKTSSLVFDQPDSQKQAEKRFGLFFQKQ